MNTKSAVKRITKALQIQDLPCKMTSAAKEPLVANNIGLPAQPRYNYVSIIGMLQYLQVHS